MCVLVVVLVVSNPRRPRYLQPIHSPRTLTLDLFPCKIGSPHNCPDSPNVRSRAKSCVSLVHAGSPSTYKCIGNELLFGTIHIASRRYQDVHQFDGFMPSLKTRHQWNSTASLTDSHSTRCSNDDDKVKLRLLVPSTTVVSPRTIRTTLVPLVPFARTTLVTDSSVAPVAVY